MSTGNLEHLILRPVAKKDIEAFFEHQNDPEANELAAFGAKNPGDRVRFFSRWEQMLTNEVFVIRTICFGQQVLGYIAHFEQLGRPAVGCWIDRAFWGRGVATDALRQFLLLIKVRPLFARVAAHNTACISLLLRNGFIEVGRENSLSVAADRMVEEVLFKLDNDRQTAVGGK